MKLYEFVLQQEENKWRNDFCLSQSIDANTYITEGFCPMYFKCFENTEFGKPTYPHAKDKTICKQDCVQNSKKCIECWNREIKTEYEIYLRLKEKYESEK